jgi:hypothetical protein
MNIQEMLDRGEETARNYRLATATLLDMIIKHERDIEELKSRIIRHEELLSELPEAIRQKIGFNSP